MAGYPKTSEKDRSTPVASPSEFITYLHDSGRLVDHRPLDGVILSYQSFLAPYVDEKYDPYIPAWAIGGMKILGGEHGSVGFLNGFGIGAPSAAVLLEEYIALGTSRFLSIGSAGALSPTLDIGDAVVCTGAIRDEGTSWHYKQGSDFALPSKAMTQELSSHLTTQGVPFQTGGSWTIDAPFMETREEVEQYAADGILTVEMEASALFTIAEVRGVQIGSAFAVSDNLYGGKWNPRFHDKRVKRRLKEILDISVEILSSE